MIDLDRDGDVFVLTMRSGENRINQPFVDAFQGALDEAEASTGPAGLVTTGEDRFFSNGLDLDWLSAYEGTDFREFVSGAERLLARLIAFPMITVAAVNGHCFAAGAMLALCHDFRVMRSDRGYFCLPEVDLGIPFTPGMDSLIKHRLPARTAHEVMVTGKRYGGIEAESRGIVDRAVDAGRVLPEATAIAREFSEKRGDTLRAIKGRLYATTIDLLAASPGTAPPAG